VTVPRDTDVLASIDAKLTALLALAVATTADDLPSRRSPDRLLVEAGLSTAQAAQVLGKTERAVQLVLQKEKQRQKGRKS
jgi:hypothetical protein